jgi:hypothetical protein
MRGSSYVFLLQVLIHPGSTKGAPTTGHSESAESAGSAQLHKAEAVVNTATLRGTRVSGQSVGTQAVHAHDESHESRRIETGHDWLDNNGVNVLMAALMSLGGMCIAQWVWGVDVRELWV